MPPFASSRTAFVLLLLVGLLVWIRPAGAVTTTVNVGPSLTNTFSPSSVTINPGDAIKWQWISGFHTTTSGVFADGPNGLWDSPIDAGTTSFTRTFSISGIYPYYCQFHGFSGMTGTITVGTISCSIAGPTPVCANASGLIYTATIAPAGGAQTFSWSITGNGTIVGSSTAATVSVSSTGAGSFTLTMLGTKSGTQVMCTKVVTVSTATTCTINGNASVLTGSTGNGYTSTVSPAGGTVTYSWSISGNGSITSGTTASSCTVTAGAVGSFTLTLNVIRSGCPGSCQKVVTVITPSCTISGPTPVFAGSTGIGYTSTVSPAGGVIVYSWSISGNGSITSATNTSSVTVTAGAAGSFTLTLDGTRDGTAFQCTKPVTVDPAPSCTVAGPDTVAASSSGTIYAANISPSGGTQVHSWSITGNGSITSGTTGPSVTVTALASGSFTVIHDGTRDGIALSCQKTVTIQAGGPAATVTATDFVFTPPNVVIDAGQSVEWVWGNGLHTTTNGVSSAPADNPGSLWDAPLDSAHPSFTFQFNTPGFYPYFCRVHEAVMKGTIQVRATTGIGGDPTSRFRLLPAPNPFADKVNLHFILDKDTRVVLDIFDLGGRKVENLIATNMSAGPHDVTWSGLDTRQQPVVPGVYFARLQAGDGRMQVQKLFKSR
jgi:plastocyanin